VVLDRLDPVDGHEDPPGLVAVEARLAQRLVGVNHQVVERAGLEVHRDVVQATQLGTVGAHDVFSREILGEDLWHTPSFRVREYKRHGLSDRRQRREGDAAGTTGERRL